MKRDLETAEKNKGIQQPPPVAPLRANPAAHPLSQPHHPPHPSPRILHPPKPSQPLPHQSPTVQPPPTHRTTHKHQEIRAHHAKRHQSKTPQQHTQTTKLLSRNHQRPTQRQDRRRTTYAEEDPKATRRPQAVKHDNNIPQQGYRRSSVSVLCRSKLRQEGGEGDEVTDEQTHLQNKNKKKKEKKTDRGEKEIKRERVRREDGRKRVGRGVTIRNFIS